MQRNNYYQRDKHVTLYTKRNEAKFLPINYPQAYSSDVFCVFCKQTFNFGLNKDRVFQNNYKVPVLLNCGHSSCFNCVKDEEYRTCPLGCAQLESTDKKLVSLNVYAVGLVFSILGRPIQVQEPEIVFDPPSSAVLGQNFDHGCCNDCGIIATYECEQCKCLLCTMCFNRIHRKALKDHKKRYLKKEIDEFKIYSICEVHDKAQTYYCENCNIEVCADCALKDHKSHDTSMQLERNQLLLPEFEIALKKAKETKIRMQQQLQNLKNNVMDEIDMDKYETALRNITDYFLRLHGKLQLIEENYRSQIKAQKLNVKKIIDDKNTKLKEDIDKIDYFVMSAEAAKKDLSKLDLGRIIIQLKEISQLPCHIILEEDKAPYKCNFTCNWAKVMDCFDDNMKLEIPELPKFMLVPTSKYIEDHELAPLPEELSDSSKSFETVPTSPNILNASRSSSTSQSSIFTIAQQSILADQTIGTSNRIKISHFISPSRFYVQTIENHQIAHQLDSEINNDIQKNGQIPDAIIEKRIYAVLGEFDSKYHRGRIMKKTEICDTEIFYDVFYIDWGVEEKDVTIDRIKKFNPSISCANPLASYCTMPEIAPIEESWSEKSISFFKEIMNHNLTMKVWNESTTEKIVDLFTSNYGQPSSVYSLLINLRHAKPVSHYKLMRMNPSSSHQFFFEEIPYGKRIYVVICNVESPNCIYVKKVNSDIKELQERMQAEYSKNLGLPNSNIDFYPENGKACAVKVKNEWKRGVVLGVFTDNEMVQVFLVDDGYLVDVSISLIRKLPLRFIKYNAQAIKVSMLHIEPIEGEEWPIDTIIYVKKELENTLVDILAHTKYDVTYNVTIHLKNNINFNNHLVTNGYAVSTGLGSVHSECDKKIPLLKPLTKKDKKKALKMVKSLKNKETRKNLPNTEEKKITILKNVERKNRSAEELDPFKVRIKIQNIVSPDLIYISVYSNEKPYRDMMIKMKEFYKVNQAKDILTDFNLRTYYAVYSDKDKQYCRARFLETISITHVRMFMVDLAEEQIVTTDLIQPLPSEFTKAGKYLIKVKLAGIRPCGGQTWLQSSIEKLRHIILDENNESKFFMENIGTGDEDVLLVNITMRKNVITGPTTPNRKVTISVASELVKEMGAIPIQGYREKEIKQMAIDLKKKLQLENTSAEDCHEKKDKLVLEVNEDQNNKEKQSLESSSSDTAKIPELGKIIDWIPALEIIEDEFEANISYVDYNADVYFCSMETHEQRELMKFKMQEIYDHMDYQEFDDKWEIGDLCIARYHVDKLWHRGKIIDILNEKVCKVKFVDYGNEEECVKGDVRKAIAFSDRPIFCTKASIAGLKPTYGDFWKESDLDKIHLILLGYGSTKKIRIWSRCPNKMEIGIWLQENTNNYYEFRWYLKNKTDTECIIDKNVYFESFQSNMLDNETTNNECLENIHDPSVIVESDSDSSKDDVSTYEDIINDSIEIASSEGEDSKTCDNNKNHKTSVSNDLEIEIDKQSEQEKFNESETIRYEDSNTIMNNLSDKFQNVVLAEATINHQTSNTPEIQYGSNDVINFSNCSFEKKHYSDSLTENSYGDESSDGEKIFAGNLSTHPKINETCKFETESIQSDMSHIGDALVASTPLNGSFYEDEKIYFPEALNFKSLQVTEFRVKIKNNFNGTESYGHLKESSNAILSSYLLEYKKMKSDLQNCAENQAILPVIKGKFYCVKLKDKKWYRCYIKQILGNPSDPSKQSFSIFLIDKGEKRIIHDSNQFRSIKKEWLQIPMKSFKLKLWNVEINPEAEDTYIKLKGNFYAKVKQYEPTLELQLFSDQNRKLLAYLNYLKKSTLRVINPLIN